MATWDRLEGEPGLWYSRFDKFYRAQGVERNLQEAINLWRVSKGKERTTNIGQAWTKAFREWNWRERAEAWDASEREREMREENDEWERRRKARLRVIEKARTKVIEALDEIVTEKLSTKEILALAEFAADQERTEWASTPTGDLMQLLSGRR